MLLLNNVKTHHNHEPTLQFQLHGESERYPECGPYGDQGMGFSMGARGVMSKGCCQVKQKLTTSSRKYSRNVWRVKDPSTTLKAINPSSNESVATIDNHRF